MSKRSSRPCRHFPGMSPRRAGVSLFEAAVALLLFVVILSGAMDAAQKAGRQGREEVAAQDLSHLADLVEAHVLQNWNHWVTPMVTLAFRLDWAAMATLDPSMPTTPPQIARYDAVSAWLVAGTGLWVVVLTEGPPADAHPVPPPSTPTVRHVGVVSPVRPGVAVGRGFEVGLDAVEADLGGSGMLTGALVAARALDRPGPLSPYMHAADQTGGAPGHPRAELHRMETDLQMWDEPAETAVFCTILARWSSAPCSTPGNVADPDSLRGYNVFGLSRLDVPSVTITGMLDLGGTMSVSGSMRVPSGPVRFGAPGADPDATALRSRELPLPPPAVLTVTELESGGPLTLDEADIAGNLGIDGLTTITGLTWTGGISGPVSAAEIELLAPTVAASRYGGSSLIVMDAMTVSGNLGIGSRLLLNHCRGSSCPR